MVEVGRTIVMIGLVIVTIGVIVWALGRAGFHGLPGDIAYKSDNVRIYFPIVSCIVLSVLLTVGMCLWRWLSGR